MARAGVVVILFCYFQMLMTKSITDDTPEECKKYGICANVENYPTELARKLIAELKAQNILFNVDEPPEEPTTVEWRFGSDEDMEADKQSLCKSIKMSWQPQVAYHESGDLKYILNNDQPLQAFNAGICPNSNGPRDDISMICRSETMMMGYEGQCIEKTRLVEMYYIEGNRTARGYFLVPTCCSCDLKRI
ncbi:unnamed protein product, partial [Brenthis ino]